MSDLRGTATSAGIRPQLEFVAEVLVFLKPGVNDPEGLAIRAGLHSLGYDGVTGVRTGKYLRVVIRAEDAAQAGRRVAEMCDTLLSNPVIEHYRISLSESPER